MSTHNICFYGELEKIIPELSSKPPYYLISLHYQSEDMEPEHPAKKLIGHWMCLLGTNCQ